MFGKSFGVGDTIRHEALDAEGVVLREMVIGESSGNGVKREQLGGRCYWLNTPGNLVLAVRASACSLVRTATQAERAESASDVVQLRPLDASLAIGAEMLEFGSVRRALVEEARATGVALAPLVPKYMLLVGGERYVPLGAYADAEKRLADEAAVDLAKMRGSRLGSFAEMSTRERAARAYAESLPVRIQELLANPIELMWGTAEAGDPVEFKRLKTVAEVWGARHA